MTRHLTTSIAITMLTLLDDIAAQQQTYQMMFIISRDIALSRRKHQLIFVLLEQVLSPGTTWRRRPFLHQKIQIVALTERQFSWRSHLQSCSVGGSEESDRSTVQRSAYLQVQVLHLWIPSYFCNVVEEGCLFKISTSNVVSFFLNSTTRQTPSYNNQTSHERHGGILEASRRL